MYREKWHVGPDFKGQQSMDASKSGLYYTNLLRVFYLISFWPLLSARDMIATI